MNSYIEPMRSKAHKKFSWSSAQISCSYFNYRQSRLVHLSIIFQTNYIYIDNSLHVLQHFQKAWFPNERTQAVKFYKPIHCLKGSVNRLKRNAYCLLSSNRKLMRMNFMSHQRSLFQSFSLEILYTWPMRSCLCEDKESSNDKRRFPLQRTVVIL